MNKMVGKLKEKQKTGEIASNSEDLDRWEEKYKFKSKRWKRKTDKRVEWKTEDLERTISYSTKHRSTCRAYTVVWYGTRQNDREYNIGAFRQTEVKNDAKLRKNGRPAGNDNVVGELQKTNLELRDNEGGKRE